MHINIWLSHSGRKYIKGHNSQQATTNRKEEKMRKIE
jgi:hypothetical protein